MAERRMFAKTIIDSDLFLDMPSSTQCLYFHLSMRADDDGFINNPKKIQRMVGGSDDDLKLLIAKNFLIPFESGVVVIKHWKIHNYIQKDRYKPTLYQQELEQLEVDRSKNYQIKLENSKCIHDVYIPDTSGIPLVDKTDTQVRLGKDSIDKNNIDIYIEDGNVDKYVDESNKLKEFRILYEQNIGFINGITAEYLIELSETIEVNLFKRAIEIATDRGKCSLGYIKGIIKQWLDVNIKTLEQLEAYKLQQEQSKKGVKSDVGRREGITKAESSTDDRESEEARRRELLRQIEELERDEL